MVFICDLQLVSFLSCTNTYTPFKLNRSGCLLWLFWNRIQGKQHTSILKSVVFQFAWLSSLSERTDLFGRAAKCKSDIRNNTYPKVIFA